MDMQNQIKTEDSGLKAFGYGVLIFTFVFLGGWSYTAPLDSAAFAGGRVVVQSNSKTVQHLEGGIVNEIFVKDGDMVAANDLLLKLDDTQIKAQQEIIKGQFLSLSAQESRLLAEQRGDETLKFSDQVTGSEDPRVAEVIRSQTHVFETRKKSKDGEIKVLKQRIEQLQTQLSGLKKQQQKKQELLKLYNDEIVELNSLVKEGYANRPQLRDMQRKRAEVQANIADIASRKASAKIQIGEAEVQILQLNNKMQEEVAAQLNQVQTELFDLKERLVALDDKVKRTMIRAPAAGFVLGMKLTEDAVVGPGEPILQIVPEKDALIIEAHVSLVDIDRVAVGMSAEIRFSSFKQGVTPKLLGKVIHLSADSLNNPQTGMDYYEARLEISEESKAALKDLKVLPGMPADVLISTGDRTVWQYLVQPITDAYARSMIED